MFERMFWAISCQICVWHNFWGSCLKRWFYKFIKEIHLTSCEGHSWSIVSIFLICAPKDSWRKIRRTCPPEKTFRIICGGYPSTNVLRYSQMTSSENNCERYIFFCPKSVWRNVACDISNIFRRIFSCVSQKHILKTLAKCFWEIRHRKHVNKEAYPKPLFFTVHSFCCKVPNIQGMFRKMSLTKYLAENIQQKIPTTFERYEAQKWKQK